MKSRQPLNVLIVEDSSDDMDLVLSALKREGYDVTYQRAQTAEELVVLLSAGGWHIVISDYDLPSFSGPEALALVRRNDTDIPFFLISGKITDEIAVNVIKAGANDYVLKDNLVRLGPAVRRELAELERKRGLEMELKEKEEMVRRAQKLEALGSLAGGIVHDFNNYLAFVMIATELTEGDLPSAHPALARIREIRIATQRAAGLTRQLLTFCKRQRIDPQVVEINEMVHQCNGLFSRLIPDEIRIDLELQAGTAATRIDPSQLEQILMNLVVNAKDAMPFGGVLKIKTFTQGSWVGLTVQDNGVGMDEATKLKIFEPFFTTKGPERGTGLGLSTVMSIVTECGGRLELESASGKGSAFTVQFPLVQVSQSEREDVPEQMSDLNGSETILLLEDDRGVRDMMEAVLKRHGYNVITASSADHATRIAQTHPAEIHVLLSDVAMPQTNGIEFGYLFTQIRQNAKVLFVTGYYDKNLFEPDELDFFRNVLQKPFSGAALLEKLRSALVN
ncbi:MAG: response regulator [Bdellovibrionales bacterium]